MATKLQVREAEKLLKQLYPEDDGSALVLDSAWEQTAQDYLEYQRIKVAAEEKMTELALRLKEQLTTSASATVGDFEITWKTAQRKEYVVPPARFRQFSVKKVR